MKLLDAWKNTRFDRPPYVFDGDAPIIKSSPRAKDLGIIGKSCDEVEAHPDYDREKSIHFSLLPQPFIGDIMNAKIYVLTLNPGFACSDYDEEYRDPGDFRERLLDNLEQENQKGFMFLDPELGCTGGYKYWHARLRETIGYLAKCWDTSPEQIQKNIARKLAVIELVPYHSKKADGLDKLPEMLPSARIVLEFVRQYVRERVRSDVARVIVARRFATWKYALDPCLVSSGRVTRNANRGGWLSPKTEGGKAIIDWFCRSKP